MAEDTERHAHREESHVTTEAEIGLIAASQGMPRTDGHYQRLEEARKDSTQSQRARPGSHLHFALLASRSVSTYISVVQVTQFVVLKPCSLWLGQP